MHRYNSVEFEKIYQMVQEYMQDLQSFGDNEEESNVF